MLISIIAILIAISIHEFAHAWVADRLGDPTPSLAGRLTLNPLAHLDPIGTLALFLIGFGWGKPVPIDPYNLRHPRRDQALIALAGPLSNFLFSLLIALAYRLLPIPYLFPIIRSLLIISLSLGIFNLLPLYPLDGNKILIGFLPLDLARDWSEILERYSLPLLLITLFPIFQGHSLIELLLGPLISFLLRLLL